MIPEWLKTSVERAGKLIEFLQPNGTHYIRSHFNIDPTSGFDFIKAPGNRAEKQKKSAGAELVAFPQHGVEVLVGNDNIQDHWSTFGPGHMLRKVKLIAGLYGYNSEWALSRTLGFATRYILPLDDKGKQ
ncbi:hypothetical protein [Chitinophaga polysaccharea]|uniref:hypothetical protein n=1 Tax=Chitinophaga polysaccharea TaxID=1293035 RepID=UPI001C8E7733|nr:hypothetical protein [Chitinophaga polysaccharea]